MLRRPAGRPSGQGQVVRLSSGHRSDFRQTRRPGPGLPVVVRSGQGQHRRQTSSFVSSVVFQTLHRTRPGRQVRALAAVLVRAPTRRSSSSGLVPSDRQTSSSFVKLSRQSGQTPSSSRPVRRRRQAFAVGLGRSSGCLLAGACTRACASRQALVLTAGQTDLLTSYQTILSTCLLTTISSSCTIIPYPSDHQAYPTPRTNHHQTQVRCAVAGAVVRVGQVVVRVWVRSSQSGHPSGQTRRQVIRTSDRPGARRQTVVRVRPSSSGLVVVVVRLIFRVRVGLCQARRQAARRPCRVQPGRPSRPSDQALLCRRPSSLPGLCPAR